MAERLRAAGSNVTDETRLAALRECTKTFAACEEAAEELRSLKSAHSHALKKWKKSGITLSSLKRSLRDRFIDPAEILLEETEYLRFRALQNMPTIQQDLLDMLGVGIDLPDEDKAEIDRQRFRDDGSFSARQKQPRDANPHAPGSEAHQSWDLGWLHDQERIAAAMGAGEAPVNTSRQKPGKAAAKKAAPKKAARRRVASDEQQQLHH